MGLKFAIPDAPVHAAPAATPSPAGFAVSDKAAARIGVILKGEAAGAMLRVSVEGGGCSGFQYKFAFDTNAKPDDLKVEKSDVTVLVDAVSAPLLAGSELDYVTELLGSSFQIKNPNATASCGCGTSFSV